MTSSTDQAASRWLTIFSNNSSLPPAIEAVQTDISPAILDETKIFSSFLPAGNDAEEERDRIILMNRKIRVGTLISGGGSNLQAVIDACEAGIIDAEVVFTGADNADARGLQRAAVHGIPQFYVDYAAIIRSYASSASPDRATLPMPPDVDLATIIAKQKLFAEDADPAWVERFFMTRISAEFQLLEKMKDYPFDLLILAGFMRKLTPWFIDRINADAQTPRIMNIHPALLPAFPGLDGYGDTVRYGCKVGGCTVHFVDYGEDSGPIIGQKAFPIEPEDTLDDVKAKGLALEWQLYPECIQLFAENRLRVEKKVFETSKGQTAEKAVVTILPA
jgi:phosphoribosylglycinamide formyltransferase-1